ncbi:MAG: hypothetical protein LBP19_08270 [Treponema sp.]|jgi:hypothetical protein|nr:hypothetical protein [Treponema sp.]
MNVYKPLRLVLFLYEIIRFIDMIKGVRLFSFINDLARPDMLQTLVWFAPNMLFPLMTFFLLISLDAYATYLPLYMAGKCVTLALSVRLLVDTALYHQHGSGVNSLFVISFLTVGDVMCIIASILIGNNIKKCKKYDTEPLSGDDEA